jgi:uncharacterized membrane protein YjfL (UPF0719 family)
MSGDEVAVLMFGWALAIVGWTLWYRPFLGSRRLRRWSAADGLLAAAPLACIALILWVLVSLAASDVRTAPEYVLLYLGLGMAWVVISQWLTLWMGIGARDDAVERGNPSAACAVVGALIGLTFCYAGANIGEGPGWWVVVFCAALTTTTFFALWFLVEAISGVSQAVTIDRNLASGLRLGGLLVAVGLILGRSVAGNWVSPDATLLDLAARGWPVALVAGAEITISSLSRAVSGIARLGPWVGGALPAAAYLSAAAYYVVEQGGW